MTWEANRCNSCCRSRKEDWQTDVSATACVSSIASNVRAGICLVPRTHRGHVTPRSDSSLSASAATNNITATCNAMHHNTPHFSSRYRDCGPKSIGLGVIYEPLGMMYKPLRIYCESFMAFSSNLTSKHTCDQTKYFVGAR